MPNRIEIVVERGPLQGQRLGYEMHDIVLFGRAADCHIRLPEQDRTTSRHHFILEVSPPQARLRDLGSLGGTYVNGHKYGGRAPGETPEVAAQRQYPQVDLADGDEIRAGQHVLRVAVHQEITCAECGQPLPPEELPHQAAATGERLVCSSCRKKAADRARSRAAAPKATQPSPVIRPIPSSPAVEGPAGKPAAGTPPPAGIAGPAGALSPAGPAPQAASPSPAPVAPPVAAARAANPSPASPDAGAAAPLARLFQQLVPGGWRRSGRGEPAEGSRVLGEYEIGQELGRGSMGAVYLARHRHTGERVALKVMVAQAAVDEQARRRFLYEIEATKARRHPNIVALRDSGAAGDTFYFTMEYCEGGSLGPYVTKRGGRLPVDEALPLMEQVLDGMAEAHAAGFIHRDLKPDNLLLAHHNGKSSRGSPSGHNGQPVAKVADFGLAKSFADAGLSGLTVTGTRGGTFTYMPREQLVHFRDAKPVSDVWALGATFYVVLAGQPPRQPPAGQKLDPITLVLQGAVVPIRRVAPNVPERVADVIDRALQPEPAARYQAAGEMRQALAAART
jgi:serine/threonine-protein kinase